ncbi:TPA: terminase small subunit [Streptococcus suis]|nr:terminase small subunit [Streptococcus suis]NQN32928.1 terminase small subunit [Streptococcus suis]NQO50435.1 terminase small subunit [Streptococcus suis]NQP51372.1 terminase small subunit [Streptococcus suis]HEL2218482.1 terminase small subunit [Streptococcus suis]
MNSRERRFADEYIANGNNATRAYKVVYPTSGDNTARTKGSNWVAKDNILNYIKIKTKERLDASGLKANDIIDRLIDIAFGRPIIGYSKQTNKITGEVIKHIEYENTAPIDEQIKALELLGKYLKLFTDKVEAEVNGTVVFANEADIPD